MTEPGNAVRSRATAARRRRVLALNMSEELFAEVAPLLDREEFEVDRFPRAAPALDLLQAVKVDAVLVGFPLEDVPARELLGGIREARSESRASAVLLVCSPEAAEEARELIGRGANRVMVVGEGHHELQATVSELLAVAPRRSVRAMVKMEVKVGDGREMAFCQTENVSATGMLIRSDTTHPVGAELDLEFFLGDDPTPLRARAEVVRHTLLGRDAVQGVGLRFLAFERGSRERFLRTLDRLAPKDPVAT